MARHLGRNGVLWLLCLMLISVLSLLPGPPLRLVSSTSLLPLAAGAAPGLRTAFGAPVPVSAMGSAFAVSSVLRGSADLALSDVRYGPLPLYWQPISRIEIAVLAGPGVPRRLSLAEVRRLLRGQVRNWRQLGGESLPVRLVLRTPGSGVRAALSTLAGRPFPTGQIEALSNGQVLRLVRMLPGAIGFVEAHYARGAAIIRVRGRLPRDPSYPLSLTGYAAFRPGDRPAQLGAAILAAYAKAQGIGP